MDFADEEFWLVFFQATDLYFLGCLRDAMQPSWIVLVELIPTLWCHSWKSLQNLAAQCPVIHNSTVVHFSQQQLHLCRHPLSAFSFFFFLFNLPVREWALCAKTYIPLICRIHIREDANAHEAIWCKYLSRHFYTATDCTSQTAFCLWHFFCSTHFLPHVFKDCGSEGGAAFGVPSNTALFSFHL